jgi:dihydrofolate synthase/folylpolyglutamate synthase
MDFERAVAFLKGFNPYEDKGFPAYNEKNFNLERLRSFLKAYRVAYHGLKYVHVTGSKGKSTSCMMIGNYLWKSGYKVGVFTSPYIIDITECIWIDGKNISKDKFAKYVFQLRKFVSGYKGQVLTYFEFLTVIVLQCFVENGVDFAVIEVGLGGRLDATNIINPEVAVLTTVEKEHTEILGKTYDKILNEKLGIVIGKKVKKLVVGWQNSSVRKNVKQKVAGVREVIFVDDKSNKSVVYAVLDLLLGKVNVRLLDKIANDFKMIGRFDVRIIKEKIVIFDMAHTENSVMVLLQNLKNMFPAKKFFFLVSIMKNKNVKCILGPICKFGEEVIVTSSNLERGYTAERLKDLAKKMNCKVVAISDPELAYKNLIKKMGANNVFVVTGSHFLIGKILSLKKA